MTSLIPKSIPHFQEKNRLNPYNPGDRMPLETYSTALDYLVIGCVDLVFTCQAQDRSQVLLAQRDRPPRRFVVADWRQNDGRRNAGTIRDSQSR